MSLEAFLLKRVCSTCVCEEPEVNDHLVVLHVGGDPAGGQLGHRVGPLDVQPLAAVGTNIFRGSVQIFLPDARPGCCPPTGWSRPAHSTADNERLVLRR